MSICKINSEFKEMFTILFVSLILFFLFCFKIKNISSSNLGLIIV